MKFITKVLAGTDVRSELKALEIEYNDGTTDYFTCEIDPTNNRRKNFRTRDGKIFARTTKSLKSKLGFASGSHNACSIQSAMNKEWGLSV